ncbi:radical SAM family heme chaperone HemW [soil metagenome]
MLTVLTNSLVGFDPATLPAGRTEGLYVHIPFCFHKCHYCDFYSITRQTPERMEAFVDRLLVEAAFWARVPQVTGPIRTIFFGGGTPSLLPLPAMRRLIAGLLQRFDLTAVDEWTIECNPATVSGEYCRMLRDAGIDRLSFGAQSFHKAELATLERHHDPDDVPRSLDLARSAGFSRLNIDLIYAIPGQSLADWSDTLDQALALQTTHLSCYGLTFESNTPIAVKKRLGLMHEVEESIELQMLHHTRARLIAAGLPPYEISNYAAAGQECQHNMVYWNGGNYIALGPSGASHIEGHRWKNRPHLGEWETSIDAGRLPAVEHEILSPNRRAGELAMLLLRLSRGLRYDDYSARTGVDARSVYASTVDNLRSLGLVEVDSTAIRLSEKGLNVADAVAGEFLLSDDLLA